MFKKIVSNLPFNPGLAHQLTFYAKRLHEEESIRKTGLIFTVLAMLVQVFAVLSPAQTSLATSTNDIVYGATSKQQIVNALSSGRDTYGRTDIRQIYDYYGITLADIQSASSTTVRSRERQYVTTGRGDSPGVDTPVQVPGTGSTIYERSLNVWDIKNYENTYPAITGTASGEGLLKGKQFWILLKGCGNVTFQPIPKSPAPEIVKTAVGNGTFKVGDVMNYRIQFRNTGNEPLNNPVIQDTLAPEFEFVEQDAVGVRFEQQGQLLTWYLWPLQPSQAWSSILVKVRMRAITEARKQVCNASTMSSSNGGTVSTNNPSAERCITIDNTCPGTDLPIPGGDVSKCTITCPDGTVLPYNKQGECKSPVASCEYLKITDSATWNKRSYEAKFKLSKGASLTNIRLAINGKVVKDFGSIDADKDDEKVLTYTHDFTTAGDVEAKIEAAAKNGTTYRSGSSCTVSDTLVQPYTRITLSKGVSNVTQNIADANNKKARGGDTLEYTLSISNTGNADATNYIIDSDALNDILEYADLVSYEGASYDKTSQRLTWPAATVPTNGTITRKFSVKVKSPIPSTPPSQSDPLSFDYKLRNVFGNEVVVNLDKPIAGQTYQAVSSLPNTGPGTSLLVSFLALTVIGYFYARSRLLSKEVMIIRNELGAGI